MMTDRAPSPEKRAKDLWAAVLGSLEVQLPRSTFQTWLKDTAALSLEDGKLVVQAPNAFGAEWLEKRMSPVIERTAQQISRTSLELVFQVRSEKSSVLAQPTPDQTFDDSQSFRLSPLFTPHPRYSFNSFVVGPSNHMAFSAARAVADTPGQGFNPLFIYSGVGLGKTHLLHAIARSCMERRINYLYVTSEHFATDYISGVREKDTEKVRTKYRNVDVLLMDDVQLLEGKAQTQEWFFHTFNDLHNSNRQVVITSDRTPNSMPSFGDRLRSRFAWGLVADIQPPPMETRVSILEAMAGASNLPVEREVLAYVSQHVSGSVRALEGAFNKLLATARYSKRPLDIEMTMMALRDLAHQELKLSITPETLIEAVERVFDIEHEDMMGQRRHKELSHARQVAMFMLKQELSLPVSKIGRLMGGKNHSTVIHGIERIASAFNSDRDLREKVQTVKESLQRPVTV